MHKLRSKLTSSIESSSNFSPTNPSSRQPASPTPLDILRYRYHHGVNLGSIFVLEKSLFPSMFLPSARGDSELDAVTASVESIGLEATREQWKHHWSTSLSDADILFLANSAHINCVRVPIGYFTLGSRFCANGPFAPYASVYTDAWPAVLTICSRLRRIGGIAVLLDLHALPGGANDQDHSGTSNHKVELWNSKSNLELAHDCALFLAREVTDGKIEACVGIQLVNEACWGAGEKGMWRWAEDVIEGISGIDAGIPIYLSDAWNLGEAIAWCQRQNRVDNRSGERCPVGIAVSKYFCFSDADKAKNPQAIIDQVSQRELEEVISGDVLAQGASQVFVTEWSCALDPATKTKSPQNECDDITEKFGQAQSQRWRSHAAGAWFWTAKMDWMDGGDWGIFEMSKKGAVASPVFINLSFQELKAKIESTKALAVQRKKACVEAHVEYWTQNAPATHFQHWRFEQGWDLGFADALAFFENSVNVSEFGATGVGGDLIGALELWVLKRLKALGGERWGEFAWEWEHGFRQGVAAGEELVTKEC